MLKHVLVVKYNFSNEALVFSRNSQWHERSLSALLNDCCEIKLIQSIKYI